MRALLPLAFAAYPLVLSGLALYALLRSRPRSPVGWVVSALACAAAVLFAFLAGPWSYTSHYLRYAVLGLLGLSAAISYVRLGWHLSEKGGDLSEKGGTSTGWMVALLVFALLDFAALAAPLGRAPRLELSFPLGPGTYSVLQGGASVVTNPFHTLAGKRHALDIVELNAFGNRARGLIPRALDAYEIYGEALYSPCAGEVAAARDDLPDNSPGHPDPDHPEGNFLVLRCAEAEVKIGHLKQASLEVASGDTVAPGQPMGAVGNSGNTLEPHVHIEAYNESGELQLRFDGRLLSVNSRVVQPRPATDSPHAGIARGP